MVKVVPADFDARPQKGYVTKLKFVQGRTPEQLAAILGANKLEGGVKVFLLDVGQVKPEMLQLRGHTQSPAGKDPALPDQNLIDYPVGTGAPQWVIAGGTVDVVQELGVVPAGTPFKPGGSSGGGG